MQSSTTQVTQVLQTRAMFNVCLSHNYIDEVSYRADGKSEAWHQTKILKHLEQHGFEVTKVISATKHSTSDIIAQCPEGRFWRIEVKRTDKKVTPAQAVKLEDCWINNGLVMCASGYLDFLFKYDILTTGNILDKHKNAPYPTTGPSI